MSADCGFLNDQNICFGENSDRGKETNWRGSTSDLLCGSGKIENNIEERDTDELVHCPSFSQHVYGWSFEGDGSGSGGLEGASALALPASVYGDTSDPEEEVLPATSPCTDENLNFETRYANNDNHATAKNDLYNENSYCNGGYGHMNQEVQVLQKDVDQAVQIPQNYVDQEVQVLRRDTHGLQSSQKEISQVCLILWRMVGKQKQISSIKSMGEAIDVDNEGLRSNCHTTEITDLHQSDIKMGRTLSESPSIFKESDASCTPAAAIEGSARTSSPRNFVTSRQNSMISVIERSNMDSSRMHVFCLEHALEVEKLLHLIGGADIMILCHSDYPKVDSEAKLLADELEMDTSGRTSISGALR